MNEDPIVAEVRRVRDRHARRFGYDIHKIFADIIARQERTDRSHPLVENAEAAAKKSLKVKEEPRDKDPK